MNYEDKLRLAKEALASGSYDKETIEYIFPELCESEDERIRKILIKLVKKHLVNHERCMAESWLEKQCKQEHSWSEEDGSMIEGIKIAILDYYDKENAEEIISWLKSIKERVQPLPKQEWSEYDKIQLSEAIQMIESNGTWIRSEEAVKKVSNWLKSIKPSHWKPSNE